METLLVIAAICLILFIILATYDGFYLHIFKYGLFNYPESTFEHKTHTLRAILFPLIIYCLIINEHNRPLFLVGIGFVLLDLIVLGIDAHAEGESRKFMGGLPKWEYIIHLFSNAFHFAVIVLVLAIKINIGNETILINVITQSWGKELFMFISINLVPGAVILALLHFLLLLKVPRELWNNYRSKITCC